MANLTTTTQVDSGIEVYYDRTLLETARAKRVHTLFGQAKNLPAGSGETIKFRRYAQLSTATTPLTEGITPNGSQLSKTDILATVDQYGDYVHITDVVDLTVEDPVLTVAAEELSDQMYRTMDELTRQVIRACATSTTCATGGTVLNKADIDGVVQTLLGNDAAMLVPMIGASPNTGVSPIRESFWGIAHTDLIDDLEDVSGFVQKTNYAQQTGVLDAEWGSTGNVRWLVSTLASPAGYPAGGQYATLIIGKNAYGTINLGGNAKNYREGFGSAGTADPLHQRATSGWKGWYIAKILNESFMSSLICTNA